MTTLSEIAEATYRSKFSDEVTGPAAAAARAMREYGNSVGEVEQKVGRANKEHEQLKRQYLETERLAAALASRQRALAREVSNVAKEVRNGRLEEAQAQEIIANLVGKQEALYARQANRIRREIQDWREAAQAAQSAQSQIASATVSRYTAVEQAARRAMEMERQAQAAIERFVAGRSRSSGLDPFYREADTESRKRDIEAYGGALDELQAKFSPLFAVQLRFKKEVKEARDAFSVGAISADEYSKHVILLAQQSEIATAAIDKTSNAINKQAQAIRAAAAAEGLQREKDFLTRLGVTVPDQQRSESRAADIEALGASLDEAARKWIPLKAALYEYEESLKEIARLEMAGAFGNAGGAPAREVAAKKWTAAYREATAETREMAEELERLRQKHVPLAAIEERSARLLEEINKLRAAAKITTSEEAAAIDRVNQARKEEIALLGKSNSDDRTAQLERLRQKYDPLYAAAKRYATALGEITNAELGLALNSAQAAAARKAQLDIYENEVAALKKVEQGAYELGNGVKLSSYQMLVLGQQVNDVVATLLQGMSPMQVMFQQGPQIIGVFTSFKDALKALAAQFTTFNIAVASAASIVVVSSIGYERTQRALNELRVRLRETRDDYMQLAAAANAAARSLSRSSEYSMSDARQSALTIANSRRFPAGSQTTQTAELERLQRIAADIARVFGVDLADASRRVAAALNDPAAAARRLADDGFAGMNEEAARSIQVLQMQGRQSEATAALLDAYNRVTQNARLANTPFQQSLIDIGDAFQKLIDHAKPLTSFIGSQVVGSFTAIIRLIAQSIELVNRLFDAIKRLGDYLPSFDLGQFGELLRLAARFATNNPAVNPLGAIGQIAEGFTGPPSRNPSQPNTPVAPRTYTDEIVNRGLTVAREVNPRAMQRNDIANQMQSLRGALPILQARQNEVGITAEEAQARARSYREASDALRELAARQQGMRGAYETSMQGMQDEIRIMSAQEGARRTVIQAIVQTQRALEAEGSTLSNTQAEQIEMDVLRRLQVERWNYIDALDRQIDGQRRVADSYNQGARAAQDMEDRVRAEAKMRESAYENDDPLSDYQIGLQRIIRRLREQRDVEIEIASAREISQQDQQLEYLRREAELIGQTADVRERELAALRERQAIIAAGGDPDSDRSQTRIANARALADAQRAVEQQRNSYELLTNGIEQSFERIGSVITEAFARGEISSIKFGNVAKAVASEIAQAFVRMSFVNPVLNFMDGGTRGTIGGLFGPAGGVAGAAGGAAGGAGGLGGAGSLLTLAGGANSLFGGGLGGIANGINSYAATMFPSVFASAAPASTNAALAALGPGVYGPATQAQFLAAGGAGTSFLGMAGGVAGGFAIGSLLGTLTAGGSQARQQNSQIGAGAGALAGLILTGGNPIGALIGGGLGGAGGGLIGPGKKTNAFGYSITASGGLLDAGGLRMTGDGAGGEQALAEARQALAAVNALMAQSGVRVLDMNRVVNGQVNSEDQSATFNDAAKFFRFEASDSRINTALQNSDLSSFDQLAETIQQAKALSEALDTLTNPLSVFQQGVNDLAARFDEQIAIAARLGFGEAELRAEREKQINALFVQRDQELEAARRGFEVMTLMAQGRAVEADAINKIGEKEEALKAMRQRMLDLGLSAEDAEPYVAALSAAIAEQAAATAKTLQESRFVIQRDLDLRYNSTRAGLTGNAQQQLHASLLEAAEKARREVNELAAELTALGFPLDIIAAKTATLTQIHLMEAAAMQKEYDQRVNAARQDLDDRLFNATTDTSTLAGALAAYDRQAARERIEVAEDALVSMTRLERVQAAERLKIISDFAEQANEELRQIGGGIRAFIDGLRATPAGGLGIPEQFANAQSIFGRDLALARGGDRDALSRINSSASTLLDAGKSMYASGSQFQMLREMIISSLENLPAVKSYDELMLAELQKLGGSVDVQVELETIRVITEALNALPEGERAQLVQAAIITRTIEERLGRGLTAQESAALVRGEEVLRTVSQALGRSLTPIERSLLLTGGVDARFVEQAIGRSLTAAERATLVSAGTDERVLTQLLGRTLNATERGLLIGAGADTRIAEQILGRTLTPTERLAIVSGGLDERTLQQLLGRTLTDAERASIVQRGTDVRTVEQVLGRPLTAQERASLVAAGDVQRTIAQSIGRNLTAAELQSLVTAGPVLRTIEQAIGRKLTVAEAQSIVQSGNIQRTIAQIVAARTGAALVLGGTFNRDVTQKIETTETVQISRSIDDKLSGILRSINSGIVSLNAVSQAGFASVAQSVGQGKYVSPGQALSDSGMLPGAGLSNNDYVRMLYRTFLRREVDASGLATYGGGLSAGTFSRADVLNFLLRSQEMYGTNPITQQALQGGGWVGNGVWNRDSVIAAYAGGGNIALAGGEYVVRAPMAARYANELPSMNAGTWRANDNSDNQSDIVRMLREELKAVRLELAKLRSEMKRGAEAAEKGAAAAEDTAETNREMARRESMKRPAVGKLRSAG